MFLLKILFITEMTSFDNKEIVKTIAHFYVKKKSAPLEKKASTINGICIVNV